MDDKEKEVKTVTPDEWPAMTPDQLISQKTIMLDRYEFFISKGYVMPAKMMLEGIEFLDSLILGR
jgi:hypothetical protein